MDFVGAVIGLSVATWAMLAVAVVAFFPLAWLWMLVDSIIREPADYPGGDVSEKILWIVLMLALQPAAILYFFLVWRRDRKAAPATTGVASAA